MTPGARRPDWKWRTFPVFAAFVFGALVASFIDRPDNDIVVGIRIALIVLAALCFAHIFVTYYIAPRRRGAVRPRNASEYEDALVYEKDEDAPPGG